MKEWQRPLIEEWRKRLEKENEAATTSTMKFPLIHQAFDENDVLAMTEVIISGRLTMSQNVFKFEQEFAKFVGAPYAIMVNSGSSANLLALAAATNLRRTKRLSSGDEVMIPAVCWSTSVWPLFQMGLKPIFVDVNPKTLNMDMVDFEKKLTSKTKAVMAVHILGNACDMNQLREVCQKKSLMLIEDTCESLGSTAQGKMLGTMGEFGTYSFYFSHHMTTGEGGMVVCTDKEDYELLRSLRAHGWSRDLSNKAEFEKQNPKVDPRFLFVNIGYNLRPMEVQGALGISQLKKLPHMNEMRVKNRDLLIKKLRSHHQWKNQFEFVEPSAQTKPVWFGFCALLNSSSQSMHRRFLNHLTEKGIENRPIVSGNFVHQPALKLYGLDLNPSQFPGAEAINERGFFIGLHAHELSTEQLDYLANSFLSFNFDV